MPNRVRSTAAQGLRLSKRYGRLARGSCLLSAKRSPCTFLAEQQARCRASSCDPIAFACAAMHSSGSHRGQPPGDLLQVECYCAACKIWLGLALMPGMPQLLCCCGAKHCPFLLLCSRSISCSRLAWHVCIKLKQYRTPLQASSLPCCCCPSSALHPLQWQPAPPSCRQSHLPTSHLTSTAPHWTPPSSTRPSVLQSMPLRCAHHAC